MKRIKHFILFLFLFALAGCLSTNPTVRKCQVNSRVIWGQCSKGCIALPVTSSILCLGDCTIRHIGKFASCGELAKPEPLPQGGDVKPTRKQCNDVAWYKWRSCNNRCKTVSGPRVCFGNCGKQLLYERKKCEAFQ